MFLTTVVNMTVFNKKPNPLNREKKTNKKRRKQKRRSSVSASKPQVPNTQPTVYHQSKLRQ